MDFSLNLFQFKATHLSGRATHLSGRATHLSGRATHLSGRATHLSGRATHLSGRATSKLCHIFVTTRHKKYGAFLQIYQRYLDSVK